MPRLSRVRASYVAPRRLFSPNAPAALAPYADVVFAAGVLGNHTPVPGTPPNRSLM